MLRRARRILEDEGFLPGLEQRLSQGLLKDGKRDTENICIVRGRHVNKDAQKVNLPLHKICVCVAYLE
jgi:hypothetical protein